MRAVIQRVSEAKVTVDGCITGEIGPGLLVLLGIEATDRQQDIQWLSNKICNLRVFRDGSDQKNLSVRDTGGDILLVSNFTLHASVKKGNRPTYIKAAEAAQAEPLYNAFIKQLQADLGKHVQTGQFGAMMEVALVNDGPVTIIIDSKNKE